MELYIATLAELKAEVGITDTDDDTLVTRLGVGLQARFDAHCNRTFLYSATEQEILDGGVTSLLVRRWPIAAVSEIIIDEDQEWNAEEALETDDYRVNHGRGRIVYGTGLTPWPAGTQNIRVSYSGGFVKSDGTLATYAQVGDLVNLRYAFFQQFAFAWRNRETNGLGQVSAGGASKAFGAGVALALAGMTLLPDVDAALQPLRRM